MRFVESTKFGGAKPVVSPEKMDGKNLQIFGISFTSKEFGRPTRQLTTKSQFKCLFCFLVFSYLLHMNYLELEVGLICCMMFYLATFPHASLHQARVFGRYVQRVSALLKRISTAETFRRGFC